MKKIIMFFIAALLGVLLFTGVANAADKADFNPGFIIDDYVFYNSDAMNAGQVQNFLNAKNPNCDYNGTQPASDWGYPGITHAQLAEYKRNGTNGFSKDTGFHAPPYKCLTVYTQNTPQMEAASGLCGAIPAYSNRTAAQIIKDVANACSINPQVLIILLEKEQSLITDKWPLNRQLNKATGFACPDTAPCDPSYGGFYYQVYYAARQFKVYQANPNNYNYKAGRDNIIKWNPNSSCGTSTVYIQNQATAALYIYTPYRPNQAALNNLYGTGDSCSSYGNRNFWRIFTDWFGSTTGAISELKNRYVALGASSGKLGPATDVGYCNSDRSICWQGFRNGFIIYSSSTGAWESRSVIRDRWGQLGYQNGVLGFPTGPESTGGKATWQQYQNGAIIGTPSTKYWESYGPIRDRWGQVGYQTGKMGYPTGPVQKATNGMSMWQEYQNGFIIYSTTTGTWESKGSIRERWGKLGYQTGVLGFPAGKETYNGSNGFWQVYQNGAIIGTNKTGYWESYGLIRERWGKLGYQTGAMGYPTSAVKKSADGKSMWQEYQKGFLIYSDDTGAWESKGAIRERWGQLGYQTGAMGFPIGPERYNSTTKVWSQEYQNGSISYHETTRTWSVSP